MAKYKHGKKGRVNIGGANYKVTEWDADDVTEGVEVTNTESDGYQEMDEEGGVEKLSGSITMVAEEGTTPPAKGMLNTVLYEGSKESGEALAFKAFFGSVKRSNKVKSSDPITWQVSYESSGEIGRGTATVPDPVV